jgi:hypothetical protein
MDARECRERPPADSHGFEAAVGERDAVGKDPWDQPAGVDIEPQTPGGCFNPL